MFALFHFVGNYTVLAAMHPWGGNRWIDHSLLKPCFRSSKFVVHFWSIVLHNTNQCIWGRVLGSLQLQLGHPLLKPLSTVNWSHAARTSICMIAHWFSQEEFSASTRRPHPGVLSQQSPRSPEQKVFSEGFWSGGLNQKSLAGRHDDKF